jgi:hypothetical protein
MITLTVTTKKYPESAVIYPATAQQLLTGFYTQLDVEHRDVTTNQIVKKFQADLGYAISTLSPGYGKMSGLFFIKIKPVHVLPTATNTLLQTVAPAISCFGFKACRERLGLTQKQIIRRTGLSPFEISKLENDKLPMKGLHENTWSKLKLGYGEDFVTSVRDSLRDLPSANA